MPFILNGLFMSLDIYNFIFFNLFIIIFMLFSLYNYSYKYEMLTKFFVINLEKSFPSEKILKIKNLFIIMFMLIFINNLLSLYPHIFSTFSLMTFTLIFSLSFWVSMMICNLCYFMKEFLIHLTPVSTPIVLMSFMVLIEFVSQIIRPITLLVRLGTNLTTGHLILGLISFTGIISFTAQIMLFLLELMVALVQSYVFSLLIILYFNE